MIDLEPYPEHTDQVLESLRWYHDENNTEATTYRLIAGECPDLNKDQVKYRIEEHLIEDGYLDLDWVEENGQGVAYVGPCEDALETARAREKTKQLLGEVPEEPTKDDILKLVNYVRSIQTGIDSDELPDFIQNQEDNTNRIEDIQNSVKELKNTVETIENQDNTVKSNRTQIQDIEDRVDDIETKMGFNSGYGDEINFSDYKRMKALIKWHDEDLKHLARKAEAGYFYVQEKDIDAKTL